MGMMLRMIFIVNIKLSISKWKGYRCFFVMNLEKKLKVDKIDGR